MKTKHTSGSGEAPVDSAKKADSVERIRGVLSPRQFEAARDGIERQLHQKREAWHLLGWHFNEAPATGQRRLVLHLEAGEREREEPRRLLRLPKAVGGKLGVRIERIERKPSRLVRMNETKLDAVSDKMTSTLDQPTTELAPLAPGVRIVVGFQRRFLGGIACVALLDGEPYLITCGHLFAPGPGSVPVRVGNDVVANLTGNFLEDDQALDAAFCKLTARGVALLQASQSAPSWCAAVVDPTTMAAGDLITFFPTNLAAVGPASTEFEAAPACEHDLHSDLWNDVTLCGLVMAKAATENGDSGTVATTGGVFLGICTGGPSGPHSFFTPLSTVFSRLSTLQRFSEVALWSFDGN